MHKDEDFKKYVGKNRAKVMKSKPELETKLTITAKDPHVAQKEHG